MLATQPIRAKLSIPRIPPDLVARPRLVERLNQGLSRQLTLVCSPAGYGKTTLVSEWLQQLSIPTAWLTLDEGDDNLFFFLSYVVAAVQSTYPDFGKETVSLLKATALPSQHVLVSTLVNDLDALPGSLVIVLDDLYRVTQLPIYELLEQLIAYLPPAVHLVLSTRTDPPLSLVTLRARAQLSEVRQWELRFTRTEVGTFIAQAESFAVDEATIDALTMRIDGWPVGLRLFLLSVHNNAGLERLAQGIGLEETDVTAYLIGEVIRKQPPAIQEFLLHLSIVERFSLPLCMALFPQATWQEAESMLNHLQRENLFVTALGEGWYRYHPLLRDLLLHRLLNQTAVEEVAELHRRAAGWYESQGMVSEAIYHLLAAPDEALALAMLARYRMQAMNREQWQQVTQWLAFFPKRMVEQQPLLGMTKAWLFHTQFQVSKYMVILQRVEWQLAEEFPPLDPATRQVVEGEMCVLTSQASFFQGQFQLAAASAQRSLELLPIDHSIGRSLAYRFLVLGLNHSGDLAAAQSALQAAAEEEPSQRGNFGPGLMIIKFVMGYFSMDIVAMEESATQMEKLAQARVLPESNFWAHYYLGWLAYTRNELEVAHQHFEKVVEDRYLVHVGAAGSSYAALSLICQAQGKEEEARQVLEAATTLLQDSLLPNVERSHEAVRALSALLQGRMGEAMAWAESQVEAPILVPTVMGTREPPVVLLKILVSSTSSAALARAASLLPDLLHTARTAHAHLLTAELLALQARLCQSLGETEAALEYLAEAVTLVKGLRPLRLFADLGLENSLRLMPLLEQLQRRNLAPEYIARVLEVLGKGTSSQVDRPSSMSPSPLISTELIESLTQREDEILKLLAQGMSNRSIADQLFLSPKTVENYTLSIYSKLAVKSRGQAVAKARELGLLSR